MAVGFAIVGCGMIARFHARALQEVPGARLVALVSRHAANAKKLADGLGLDCDIETVLQRSEGSTSVHFVKFRIILREIFRFGIASLFSKSGVFRVLMFS